MIFAAETKNMEEKLKELEMEELLEYCRENGFSKEQTELFIQNSLERLYNTGNA